MNTPEINGHSPWGIIDYTETRAEGIVAVGTPGHGGYWLSPKRKQELDAKFKFNNFAGGPWYEEDCDMPLVIIAFPEYYDNITVYNAINYIESLSQRKPNDYADVMKYIKKTFPRK